MSHVFMLLAIWSWFTADKEPQKSFYDYTLTSIDGKEFPMASLRGKKVLIVNTASKCGFTPQYKDLQTLYEKFGGENFTIIAFPSNNFAFQEPGSNNEVQSFCQINYGVSFPLMEKCKVKGRNMHPLYKWLTKKAMNGVADATVKWNFHKFMVSENGEWQGSLPSSVNPMDERITNWISQ